MRNLSLRKKYSIGVAILALSSVLIVLGIRFMSDVAVVHYLEREYVVALLKAQYNCSAPSTVSRFRVLS